MRSSPVGLRDAERRRHLDELARVVAESGDALADLGVGVEVDAGERGESLGRGGAVRLLVDEVDRGLRANSAGHARGAVGGGFIAACV